MSVNSDLTRILLEGNNLNERQIRQYQKKLIQLYLQALADIRFELKNLYDKFPDSPPILTDVRGKQLQRLQSSIEERLKDLRGTNGIIKDSIMDGHIQGYMHTGYAVETSLQTDLGYALPSNRVLKSILYNPMDKIKWSSRNIQNIEKIKGAIRSQLIIGLNKGESFGKIANRINQEMNIGASKAIRILRTETGRSQQAGRNEAVSKAKEYADEIGMKTAKTWDATLDGRTRQNHADMEGKEADGNGKFIFTTMKGIMIYVDGPRLTGTTDDINCRCETRLAFADIPMRVRRDNIKKEVIPYKTYNAWKNSK